APATSATVMAIETDFVVVEPTRGMARTVGSIAVFKAAGTYEAAEHFGVSVSSVVKWMQRWQACRSAAPKRRGGVAFRPWNSRRNALWRELRGPDLGRDCWRAPTASGPSV